MLRKIGIVILILVELFLLCFSNISLPFLEVARKIDNDLFYVTDAVIIDKYEDYNSSGRRSITKTYIDVEFTIDGKTKIASIYGSANEKEDNVGDNLTIVQSKNEWFTYRIPFKYTENDLSDCVCFCIGLVLLYRLITGAPSRLSKKQIIKDNRKKTVELLIYYHENNQNRSSECEQIKKYLKKEEALKLYNDLALIIEKVQLDELIEYGFLFRENTDGEFEFITTTDDFRKKQQLQGHIILREVENGYIVYSIRDDCIYFYNNNTYKYEFIVGSLIKYLIMIKNNKLVVGYVGNSKE